MAALQSGEAELAVLLDHDLPPDVVAVPVMTLVPQVLVATNHALAAYETLTPVDLAPFGLVLLNTQPLSGLVLGLLRDAGIAPQIACRAGSVDMVRAMVGQGLGPAIVFMPAGQPGARDSTVAIPLSTTIRTTRVVVVHRVGASLSLPADQFIQRARVVLP